MQENPKPPSTTREMAHVVGCTSLASAGASIIGATATAAPGGPVHMAFAVGALGSLLTMVTALVVHGPDVLRCGRCTHQLVQTLSDAAPAEAEPPAAAAAAEPGPEFAEPVSSQVWWAA
jgi:hypothetical protein